MPGFASARVEGENHRGDSVHRISEGKASHTIGIGDTHDHVLPIEMAFRDVHADNTACAATDEGTINTGGGVPVDPANSMEAKTLLIAIITDANVPVGREVSSSPIALINALKTNPVVPANRTGPRETSAE